MGHLRRDLYLHSRRSAVLVLLCAPALARAQSGPCPLAPVVLFVCPAGTVKSAIAREALKARAAAVGIPVRVFSRGIQPEDHVSPDLAAKLRADGIDPAAEPVLSLAAADVAAADIVIAFDEAAASPMLRAARAWAVPSWNSEYPAAKAAVADLVGKLIAELAARAPASCRGGSR